MTRRYLYVFYEFIYGKLELSLLQRNAARKQYGEFRWKLQFSEKQLISDIHPLDFPSAHSPHINAKFHTPRCIRYYFVKYKNSQAKSLKCYMNIQHYTASLRKRVRWHYFMLAFFTASPRWKAKITFCSEGSEVALGVNHLAVVIV